MRLLSGMNKLYTEWSINTRDLKLSTLLQNCKNRLPDFLKTPVGVSVTRVITQTVKPIVFNTQEFHEFR